MLFLILLVVSRIGVGSGALLGDAVFGEEEDGVTVSPTARLILALSLIAGWAVAVAIMLVLAN